MAIQANGLGYGTFHLKIYMCFTSKIALLPEYIRQNHTSNFPR